jgi:putative flippase GtrA
MFNIKLESKKIRYLLAGMWNTLFGYCVSVALYYALTKHLHLIFILVIANICAITMSFLTHKYFVFKTKGDWWSEYIRSYLVYGSTALFGIVLLWITVDYLGVPFWFAQALIILLAVIGSYLGHKHFTFSKRL